MVSKVALWRVDGERPTRLPEHGDFLEKNLETWIYNDASLVLDGLRWIGRQLVLPDKSRLDLLGITPEGQWVVAELKAGPINMATLTQALHYGMYIGSMDADELVERLHVADEKRSEMLEFAGKDSTVPRPVLLLLIGTSRTSDLEGGIRFLEERGLSLQIRIVSFSLFRQPDGSVLMSREVEEKDANEVARPGSRTASVQQVRDIAEKHGVLEEVNLAIELAQRLGLKVKAWPRSITINSPADWRKTLLYIGPKEASAILGYSAESLTEVFGVPEATVKETLGTNWCVLPKADIPDYLRRAEDFLRGLQSRTKAAENTAAIESLVVPPLSSSGE